MNFYVGLINPYVGLTNSCVGFNISHVEDKYLLRRTCKLILRTSADGRNIYGMGPELTAAPDMWQLLRKIHYNDVIMSAMVVSQITILTTVYSGTYQRKHQSSASLAFVRGIHRWPVNSPHKGPVTRKMFPFDDVIVPSHGFIIR